jgi:PAS domain S-box-containing protein
LEELEGSERRLRAFLESASQGVVAIDRAGTITLVNAKTEEMFGYRREELIGAPMERLLPEGLQGQHAAHRSEYFIAPRSRPMGVGLELRGRKKGGVEFPVEISLSFVDEPGDPQALALITDISERKRLELQLQQKQKLESLGVLAGGLAHDFNNLLTGVIGNVSLALEETPAASPIRPHLEEAIEAAGHAADLTQQLLAYAGKARFLARRVDLPALLREMMAAARPALVPATVAVELDLPDGLPAAAGDSAQLRQLFGNLLRNAGEAIDGKPGGRIRIRAELLEKEPGRYVAVEVTDNGCGMDEATTARIFDPFFSTKFTGRGLGLAAARGIVDVHHGAIQVESRPGEGSTFRVLLPAAPPGGLRPRKALEKPMLS